MTDRLLDPDRELLVLKAAIWAAANGVLVTDREGIIVLVNPAYCSMTGYSEEEMLGKTPALLKSGEHGPEFYAEMWNTICSGKVWRGRIVNRKKSGELYYEDATIAPVRNGCPTITHFVAIKQDLTERWNLTMERDILDHRLQDVLSLMVDWVWETDEQDRYTFCSPRVEHVLGYSHEEVLGKTPFDFMPVEEAERVRAVFRRLKAGKKALRSLHNVNVRKDGRQVLIATNAVPRLAEDGTLLGYRGIDADITDPNGDSTNAANPE